MNSFTASLLAILSTELVSSFTALPPTQKYGAIFPSSLNLVPQQARELVAYSQAALAQKAKESASKASMTSSDRRRSSSGSSADGSASEGSKSRLSVARSLMSRIFKSPKNGSSTSLNSKGRQSEDGFDHSDAEVVYPLVGFKLIDGHALPTKLNAACSLHLSQKGIEEQVVGYFHEEGAGDEDALRLF
jgi:hypothetical protein